MNKILALIFGVVVVGSVGMCTVNAEVDVTGELEALSAFKQYRVVQVKDIAVPRVVEVSYNDVGKAWLKSVVYNVTQNKFEPSRESSTFNKVGLSVSDGNYELVDNNHASFVDFQTDGFNIQNTQIKLNLSKSTNINGVRISLPVHVAMPTHVSVTTNEGKVLVAKRRMSSLMVNFPKTRTDGLVITLSHIQPLRVSEVSVVESGSLSRNSDNKHLRFLAQSNEVYRVYFNGDRYPAINLSESANLSDNKDIVLGTLSASVQNPSFTPSDIDGDGVPDMQDNCVRLANVEQVDKDGNGRGDACDDFDKDGVVNSKDNCINQPNKYQRDEDSDGVGDACDGEESRLTEKYAWLEWVAMGLVALVLLVLGGIVMRDVRKGGHSV